VAGVGWESEFVFMEPHGFGAMKGLIAGGPGFVLWSDEADGRPGFLTSTDGNFWLQVDSTRTGRTMLALVAGQAGLVGLASHGKAPIERWASADGNAWDTAPTTGLDGLPTALLATSAGFVAAGVDRSGCGLATWISPDALAWTSAGSLPTGQSMCTSGVTRPTVDHIVGGSSGLLALGLLSGGETALWASSDGQSWMRRQGPDAGHVAQVAPYGSGYVAVGDDGNAPAAAAVWISSDGAAWTAASAQASFVGATMTDVVALADGTLASVGATSGSATGTRFVAWTSRDGQTWQRSPLPLCQSVDVCDSTGSQPTRLARGGARLMAYDGSLNILTSPRLTAGLRPATLGLAFDHPPAGTWTSGLVSGYCAPAEETTGALGFGAAYPTHLVDVGAASGSSNYIPSLQLVVGPDASVQLLVYDRGDDAGFRGETDPVAGAFQIGPDHISVAPGSTAGQGRLTFIDLPVDRSDPNLPRVPPVSGSLTWSCG
jgi:hypothetical protein